MKRLFPSGTESSDDKVITGTLVQLRVKRLSDAREDYAWQVDPDLAELDAAVPLDMPFPHYRDLYAGELWYESRTRKRYAVDTLDGTHIGNCGYYNIDDTRHEAELGIMIGDRNYWSKGYGTDIINTLLRGIFQETHFERIYLKTLESNLRAQQCFRKCGFHSYGQASEGRFHFRLMEITKAEWEALHASDMK
jgi:RimJ/RimL family protein N-acetyltransferase